ARRPGPPPRRPHDRRAAHRAPWRPRPGPGRPCRATRRPRRRPPRRAPPPLLRPALRRCPAVALLLGPAALSPGGPAPPPSPPARAFVYGGDAAFPPYEFVDAEGRPQGFNVELMRALAAQAGIPLEVRLQEWWSVLRDLDAGRVDLVSLPLTEERARR